MVLVGESRQLVVHGHTRHYLSGMCVTLERLGGSNDVIVGDKLLARSRLIGRRVLGLG